MDPNSNPKLSKMSSMIQWSKNPPGEKDLSCPETYNIKEEKVYPFLLDMDPDTIRKGVKPSQIIAGFNLTTEECLKKLQSPSRKYRIGSKKDAFKRIPEAIIFLNFSPGVLYNTTLTIINQRPVLQNLSIYFDPSRFFTLTLDSASNLTKIAPGMAIVMNLSFLPTDTYRDYSHKIQFTSGDACFSVPILALGPRPFAYMPDKLILPQTLVKVESSQIMVVKNHGKVPLNFTNVLSEPYSCNVPKAVVPPNGILEIKFSCYSEKSGIIVGNCLGYVRHGFCVKIELECEVRSAKVELDYHLITFDDVFMGLCARKVLALHNTSSYTLNFAWKMDDLDEEQREITKLIQLMGEMKEYEQQRYEKLKYMDIIDKEGHQNIYERIFQDEKQNLYSTEAFLFKSDFFEIMPKVGKVLPNSEFELSVIFAPKQNIHYYSAAYLDIEGTEKRVRVSLQGSGIGPTVVLTVRNLDAGNIYLTDKHQYELPAINKGVVPATVTLKKKETDWGGILNCIPESLVLGPNDVKAFIIVFYSEHQGEFIETLQFEVEESGERLQFIYKGNVICPLLKCIPDILDFGTISVGFQSTKEIILVNDSKVPINFDFYYEDDFQEEGSKYFNIVSSHGKVLAESRNKIKIHFSCNITTQLETNLLLVMWKNRMYTTKIPFSCTCACPEIICDPKVIGIKFCFLNCDYYRTLQFTNNTDLPGCIEYLPNETQIDKTIECIPNQTKLHFKPGEIIEMEIKIQVRSLGAHELPLKFLIIGGVPQVLCTVSCNGQGPVVSYHPDEVDFGIINVLKKYTEKLTLVNDSPITARIKVYCKDHGSFFIENAKSRDLELMPEEQIDINICALFHTTGKNKSSIFIEIFQGDQYIVKVSGVGVGTSIICEPPLTPNFNIGKILTYKNFTQEIRITNKGDMRHKMLFTKRANVRSLKEVNEDKASSVFNIIPHYIEVDPNETVSIFLKFSNKKPNAAKEEYFCHALIGKSPLVQTILNFVVEAQFVDPHLNFSKYNLTFSLNVVDNVAKGNRDEVINYDNKTGIPLQVNFLIDDENQNFKFINNNGEETLKIGQSINGSSNTSLMIPVHFEPIIKNKRKYSHRARVIVEFIEHPKTEIINLYGEVVFPTVKLYPNEINFHCVPLGSTSNKHVIIQNISAMEAHFEWFWIEKSIKIKDLVFIKEDTTKNIKLADDTVYTTDFMEYITGHFSESPTHVPEISTDDDKVNIESDKLVYDDKKYLQEMKNVLYKILFPYNTITTDEFDNVTQKSAPKNLITKLFSLEPSVGILKPNEYSIVTIGFTPPPNKEISGTAICQIRGGDEEVLTVIGKCSKLCYKLDKSCVSYGTQVFCEICSNHLTLTNNGLCTIDFKVILEESLNMQAEMLDVHPKSGKINPEESVVFKIDYFPGYPGYFNKSFVLELGYLEPVVILVDGYAVLSQVFLRVPRPNMELEVEDFYKALGWITPQYLELVKSDLFSEICDEPCDPTNFLKDNDWVYISYHDLYPSLMDMDMAAERITAFNLINKNPKLLKDHTFLKKIPYIPQFDAPEYLVDFGYVVRDIPVCYTIMIYNYGPIEANLKLIEDNKTALLEKEIKLEFKPKLLPVGETIELYVIFAPTKRKCLESTKNVEDCFRLSVKHGPLIKVRIKAVVTSPNVSLDHDILYFENVYCGDALRKTVVLTNNGYVKSKWQACINNPSKKGEITGFIVLPNAGTLEPGGKTYLHFFFIPIDTQTIKKILRIDTDSSTQPVFLELIGQGLEPNLKVVPTELKFSSTLNYFKDNMVFTVQNTSEVPVEFYFPTLDPISERERNLIKIYLKYKNVNCVFTPLKPTGTGLPDCFETVYNFLIEKLREQFELKNTENVEEVEFSATVSSIGIKSAKSSQVEDLLAKFSPKELDCLLFEYIEADGFQSDFSKDTSTYRMDDSSDRFEILEPPIIKSTPEEAERKAIIFIFHGAPTTDYYKAANQVGIALSIPVYSIDRLIIEALVEEADPVAFEILDIINDNFKKTFHPNLDIDLLDKIENETNDYDKIFDKILNILSPRSKPIKKTPRKGKESDESSDKSTGKSRSKSGDCFLNITADNLVVLLKAKIKRFSYLVIESLNSIFIPKQNQAFYIILRASGYIQYIYLMVLSYTVADYIKNYESSQYDEAMIGNLSERDKNKAKTGAKGGPELSNITTVSGKVGKASTKSEKLSRVSTGRKGILLTLNKNVKTELEEFEKLRAELMHAFQHWDKRSSVLKKPFSGSSPTKKDTPTKDLSRTGRSSTKTSLILGEFSDNGIYMYLVLNSSSTRLNDYPRIIRNFVKDNVELQTIIGEIEENNIEKFVESETLFNVIRKPTLLKNDFSSVFSIRNFNQGIDSVYPVRTRSKSGSLINKTNKRRRSSRSSRKSTDSKSFKDLHLSFIKSETDLEFSPRNILFPGEVVKYQVIFFPKKCGAHKHVCSLELVKNRANFQVECNAVCEFPQIDFTPEVMFSKTLENYREKASYDHFVYIKDQKIFDFGSIIAGSTLDKCLLYTTTVTLKNDSSSICDVNVSLSNDIFSVDPTNVTIDPKSESLLTISARSTTIGTQVAQIYISIRNNPNVKSFTLACSPCKLEFSLHPRIISFDKVPLSYSAKRAVRFTNTSPISLRWEFVDSGWLKDIFTLSHEFGFIDLYSTCDIVFRFSPTEEMSFSRKQLPIRVFDVNSVSNEPCYLDNLTIHADSVQYNLALDDHIDYGEIKGGVDNKRLFPITNNGKCEVVLKIEMVNNPLESNNFVREYFKVNPLILNIGSQKSEDLTVIIHSKSNFSAQKLLVFVVDMVESIQTGYIVKSFKVTISATCFMPSYQICPFSRVNFGYVSVHNTKKLTMELANKGKFSFNFHILNYGKFLESQKKAKTEKKVGKDVKVAEEKKSKKSDKKSNTDKGTKNKSETGKTTNKIDKIKPIKMSKLDVGLFSITPSGGIVEPNEKFIINLEISPNEVKTYEEKILINILELEDSQKKKVVTLQAVGCEPKINLKDFENVFADQYIVEKIDDFILPRNVDGCCIFSSSETSLYFKLVCVGTSLSTKLYLKNVGYVTSQLTAKIDEASKNIFTVTPNSKIMESLSKHFVEVTFSPQSLELYTGSLEMTYNASTDNKLIISLYGRACLPQIQLLKPLTKTNEAYLEFGPLCVGCERKEGISFKNASEIKCKVIVELSPPSDDFSIVPVGSTLTKLNVQDMDYISDMKRDIMINLLVDEVAEIDLLYKPIKQGKKQVTLSLHTIKNPYEIYKINLTADSYDDDVVIEGLEAMLLNRSQVSECSLHCQKSIGYHLNIGYKQLNKLHKMSFIIRNRSNENIYRFRMNSRVVLFIPEIGHLKPCSFKEVLVIFKSETPILWQKEEFSCDITTISYVNPDKNPLSWDDRLKFDYMSGTISLSDSSFEHTITSNLVEKNVSSIIEESTFSIEKPEEDNSVQTRNNAMKGTEPANITLPDSFNSIPLFLTVSADYCKYKCETDVMNFADTCINEKDIQSFVVENIGTVPLTIWWTILNKSCVAEAKRSNSEANVKESLFREDISRSFSASSLYSSVYSIETEPSIPIIIEAESNVIDPGKIRIFNLHFLPKLENNFELILQSHIDGLDPKFEEINIELNAKSLPIPFYFETEDGILFNKDINLNFENIGVATESVRKIFLINPNDDPISFDIMPKDKKEFSYFVCEVTKGTIKGKKKCFAFFYFRPPIFGSFKEEYFLKILHKNVQKTIFLHGLCREPRVYFSQKTINLKPTVPKIKSIATIKLHNDEKFPISFRFLKKYLISENQQEKLEIYPSFGKLQPESENIIKFTFATPNITSTSFYVKCLIEKHKSPLSLLVTASSVMVMPLVKYTNKNGVIIVLNQDTANIIDLGYTFKGHTDILKFEITNTGETGMFYVWKFDTSQVSHMFKIYTEKEKDFLKMNQTSMVNFNFEAIATGILKQFKLILHIMYGPEYVIYINATSDKPSYSFSFNSYNFGYCLTQTKETSYYNTILVFKNFDTKKIFIENLFKKTDFLSVEFTSSMVAPGESRHIPIKFFPRNVGSYKSHVMFLLGGMKNKILISGEGVSLNVELCYPKDKFINFGEIVLGSIKKYRVGVFNNSAAKIDVHFDLYDNLFVHKRKIEKMDGDGIKIPAISSPKEDKKDKKMGKSLEKLEKTKTKEAKSTSNKKDEKGKNKKEEQNRNDKNISSLENLKKIQEARLEYLKSFAIEPNNFINIPPKGNGYFNITFQPTTKINFEEKVYLEIQDYIEPLCVIKGSSMIPEFSLDKKEVLFSGVIVGCSSSQLITINNTGDITGSFKWHIDDKSIFVIEPKQGFVMPKNDIKIKIIFSPSHEKCEFKVKAKCFIKEFKETLTLTMKGNSVKMPEPTATVTLKCNVREKVEDFVLVNNNTSENWHLFCEVSNDAFFTPKETVAIPYNSTPITITYCPEKMTKTKPDKAELFIKLPDGSGLLYNLIGHAEPPLLNKRIEKEIRCKENFYEVIPIENWLTVKQTFKVITEVISPISTKTLYRIFGLKNVELKGKETKNYKWGVYVVNEGLIEFKVIFRTSDGEYIFFEISLKVLPCEPLETIIFDTRVREPITKQITLENPVDKPVTYLLESSERHLMYPKSVTMEPYTLVKTDIIYTPLNTESLTTSINAKCEELGTYTYLVKINAKSPRMEECVVFTSELGAKISKAILFKNTFDRTVDFSYNFDDEQFDMEKCGSIPAGESAKIIVSFEPTLLGYFESKLLLTSFVAGEYIYPLKGESVSPKPKGPFIIKLNYPLSIDFKNPFKEDKQFKFHLSPDKFRCDYDQQDIVKSKKSIRLLIYASPEVESDFTSSITGKLIVYSADQPEVQWKYYLKLQT